MTFFHTGLSNTSIFEKKRNIMRDYMLANVKSQIPDEGQYWCQLLRNVENRI